MSKKERILEAATRLFALKGFCQTAVWEVAKEAGVAQGTVFHHFKSKEQLLAAIWEGLLKDYLAGIREVSSREGTGWEAIEGVLRFSQEFRKGHPEPLAVALRETGADARMDSSLQIFFKGLMDHVLEVKEKCILRGIADGSIREVPPHETALIVHALLVGILFLDPQGVMGFPDLDRDVLEFCRRSLAVRNGLDEKKL